MKELLDRLSRYEQRLHARRRELVSDLGLSLQEEDPRHAVFATLFNHSRLTRELLHYYYRVWTKPQRIALPSGTAASDLDSIRQSRTERVRITLKMMFISAMSTLEYTGKQTLKLYPASPISQKFAERRRKGGYVYLSRIVCESYKRDLLSSEERRVWDGLIYIRNMTVHNNGIADKDETYVIDDVVVRLVKGQMTKGKLGFFLSLTESASQRSEDWIRRFSTYGEEEQL